MSVNAQALLAVERLTVEYGARGHGFVALKEVSIEVRPGECVGVVGESGSGKSTLGKAILGLAPVVGGRIRFDGQDIAHAGGSLRRELARSIQVVFQDPYGSLNPLLTIGEIVGEPLEAAGRPRREARRAAAEMLERVHLPESCMERYPSEFSGGQRQRIAIARALIRKPRLVVCDEPVSALDLATQSAIIDLFVDLQRDTGVAYLFISHDLMVIRRICHRVAVMRRGVVLEEGDAEQMTQVPAHPYSKRLLLASPVADPAKQAARRAQWLAMRESDLTASLP